MQIVRFTIPKDLNQFETQSCARPLCRKAHYLCLLARKEKLSLKELYLVEKIGFCLELKHESQDTEPK